jgi:murein DD-endopeptidase MepM/ murein hydrolase activator NlpD
MSDWLYIRLYKSRFLFGSLLAIAILITLSFVVSELGGNRVQAKPKNPPAQMLAMDMSGTPNVITSGLSETLEGVDEAMTATEYALTAAANAVASAATTTGKAIAQGTVTVARATGKGAVAAGRAVGGSIVWAGRTVGSGVAWVGRAVGTGVGFVLSLPGEAVGFVSNTQVVDSVLRPVGGEEEVQIIDPDSPELLAALTALPAKETATGPEAASRGHGPAWPIHGDITAAFGVPHRPYQPIHTGIDISDHRRAGATPIKPFRPGRVIDVVYSRYGFGNHVIVDHGKGVTSLYGHLHTISVKVGQKVGLDTTLGTEGTTGLSTGVHLHFEIRVNGQAADPRKFIDGRP